MTAESASNIRLDVAIVVIGRNEGDRLRRCLASIAGAAPIVYVDSGSVDGSIEAATAAGAEVVVLSPDGDFTAARGRNAGLAQLDDPAIRYVQMVDGDCEMQPGWIAQAAAALDADPGLVAAFGRRRERFPDASIYNRLCDIEWAVPPGRAVAFGGDVLLRRDAVLAAGGYCEAMIAGEDVDLALRLVEAGGGIVCLGQEMTVHDAAIDRFGQWWRRTTRAGHAFAELAARHREAAARPYRLSVRRILFWAGLVPVIALAGVASGWWWLTITMFGLVVMQALRILSREMRRRPRRTAMVLALFLTVGKYAEMIGLAHFHLDRWRGRRARLIEYKGGPAG